MSGYTPGPWSTTAPASYRISTSADMYFTQRWVGGANKETLTANARLIAAAPDLLEALQEAVSGLQAYASGATADTLNKAREAIAKATGQDNG